MDGVMTASSFNCNNSLKVCILHVGCLLAKHTVWPAPL